MYIEDHHESVKDFLLIIHERFALVIMCPVILQILLHHNF